MQRVSVHSQTVVYATSFSCCTERGENGAYFADRIVKKLNLFRSVYWSRQVAHGAWRSAGSTAIQCKGFLWPARSVISAVSKYQPPSRAAHQALYCWQPCLWDNGSSSLERSARDHRLIVIIADFQPSIKNSSFSTFIPSPDFWPFDRHRYIAVVLVVMFVI